MLNWTSYVERHLDTFEEKVYEESTMNIDLLQYLHKESQEIQ